MINIIIPNGKGEIQKQIQALEYLISQDTLEKDRQIHIAALKKLEGSMEG